MAEVTRLGWRSHLCFVCWRWAGKNLLCRKHRAEFKSTRFDSGRCGRRIEGPRVAMGENCGPRLSGAPSVLTPATQWPERSL